MAVYGYKISGFARTERYKEAELLLDRKLKGWEKGSEGFAEDGSVTLCYKKTEEDGSVKEVSLEKNITESFVMVLSDIPIKSLRFGGAVFYLRDIIPVALFIFGWYFGYEKITAALRLSPVFAAAAGTFVGIFVDLFSEKLLGRNRTRFRIKLIQMCWLFPLINFFFISLKIFSYYSWMQVLLITLNGPIIPIFASMLIYSMLTKEK